MAGLDPSASQNKMLKKQLMLLLLPCLQPLSPPTEMEKLQICKTKGKENIVLISYRNLDVLPLLASSQLVQIQHLDV